MLQLKPLTASRTRVNVVKKVKVDGQWKFCPVIIESSGKLKDRVRTNGNTEVHPEGVYYIEWRESGHRRRQAVPNRNEVLEQARLKAWELETAKAGTPTSFARTPAPQPDLPAAVNADKITRAAGTILQGIETYLQGVIGAAVQSQLAALGVTSSMPVLSFPPALTSVSPETDRLPATTEPPVESRPPQQTKGKKLIAEAVESFLKEIEPPRREPKTYSQYRLALNTFRDTCKKEYLQDLDRHACLAFMDHLYSVDNEARTVANRMSVVEQFLRRNGIVGLLEKGDKPKYVEGLREMYQPEDLKALFKASTPDEKVLYMFFLFTGERDKEVRYTSWSDIDFVRKRVRVTEKRRLGFKPKDKEEREIPVPSQLLEVLKQYRERQTGPNPHDLVFPTNQGRPDKNFESKIKKIVNRAGLNCGHCVSKFGNSCAEGPYCGKWFLHKFRHTFATASLESGVSIRRLQAWLGHSDLESTMIYLKFVQRKDIQEVLDKSEMAELAVESLGLADTPEQTRSLPPIQV